MNRMMRLGAVVLALVTATGVVLVAVPMILIRPFGAQTAGGLAVSYAGRRLARVKFDWKSYNPGTRVFAAGRIRAQ